MTPPTDSIDVLFPLIQGAAQQLFKYAKELIEMKQPPQKQFDDEHRVLQARYEGIKEEMRRKANIEGFGHECDLLLVTLVDLVSKMKEMELVHRSTKAQKEEQCLLQLQQVFYSSRFVAFHEALTRVSPRPTTNEPTPDPSLRGESPVLRTDPTTPKAVSSDTDRGAQPQSATNHDQGHDEHEVPYVVSVEIPTAQTAPTTPTVESQQEREGSVSSQIIVSQSPTPAIPSTIPQASKRKRPTESVLEDNETPKKPKPIDSSRPVSPFDSSTAKPPLSDEGSIDFKRLCLDGKVISISTIVTFPPNSENFYILQCRKHHLFFQSQPWKGAARHISQHNRPRKGRQDTKIDLFGVRVLNCDTDSVEKYNRAILPYVGALGRELVKKHAKQGKQVINRAQTGPPTQPLPLRRVPHVANIPPARRYPVMASSDLAHQAGGIETRSLITRPHSNGKVYMAMIESYGRALALMVLPMNGNCSHLGLRIRSIYSTSLVGDVKLPDCYTLDRQSGTFRWATGYGNGEIKENQRQFPVIVFDNQLFPDNASFLWVSAEKLKHFDPSDTKIPYHNVVHDFIENNASLSALNAPQGTQLL